MKRCDITGDGAISFILGSFRKRTNRDRIVRWCARNWEERETLTSVLRVLCEKFLIPESAAFSFTAFSFYFIQSGLGWGMCVISCVAVIYYQTIINWVLYYLGNSFQNPVPWAHCNNPWNTEFCTRRGEVGINGTNTTWLNMTTVAPTYMVLPTEGMRNVTNITRRVMTPSEEFWQ